MSRHQILLTRLSSLVTHRAPALHPHHFHGAPISRTIVSKIPGEEQHVEVTEELHTDQSALDTQGLRRRLLLNSRYRGRVETELFLGGFAADKIWDMEVEQLREFEYILAEHDIDLYNWLMKNKPMPEELQKLSVMKRIQEYIANKNGKMHASKTERTWKQDYEANDCSPPEN